MTKKLKPVVMWALYRDGEIFLIRPKKIQANREYGFLSTGSKHEWTLGRVKVIPI